MPIAPGVTSAVGLLMADVRHDYVRTVLQSGDAVTSDSLNTMYSDMENEAISQMTVEGFASSSVTLLRVADIRYAGQGYEFEVPVDNGKIGPDSLSVVFDRFHESHRRLYGYSNPDNPVEVVNLRLVALVETSRPNLKSDKPVGKSNCAEAITGQREVVFKGKPVPTHIYDRSRLSPGDFMNGPAIVEQLDSTTVVWPGQSARADECGNLILEVILK